MEICAARRLRIGRANGHNNADGRFPHQLLFRWSQLLAVAPGLMTGRTPYRVGIHNQIPMLSPMHLRRKKSPSPRCCVARAIRPATAANGISTACSTWLASRSRAITASIIGSARRTIACRTITTRTIFARQHSGRTAQGLRLGVGSRRSDPLVAERTGRGQTVLHVCLLSRAARTDQP